MSSSRFDFLFLTHYPRFSFKLWVFTWMGLGGVENEVEFDYSCKMLRAWLYRFKDGPHEHNAVVLDQFLTRSILPHKVRWFFAGRERKMTFNQKATSALESVNQTMKFSSGKRVTPNMSMRESTRTMDIQVEQVLADRHMVGCRYFRSRSLYSRSPTCNVVTKPCIV
jgi:hypothetical protein